MKEKQSLIRLISNFFRSDEDRVDDVQFNLAKKAHLFGAAAAIGSSLFYLFLYLQTGAWQTLANSFGVALALLLIGMGYISLLRGRSNLTSIFGLAAVIITYTPGELFWAEATIYNLLAGIILLVLVKLVLQIEMRKWAAASALFVGIVIIANVFEPFTRYNIKLSAALSFYIPFVTITLSLVGIWQLIQMFRSGSIRTRLVIAFLTVTIIPLILLAVVNNRLIQATLIENANQSLLIVASESAATVDDFISNNLLTVNSESKISVLSEFLSLPVSLRSQEENREPIQSTLRGLHRKDISRIISYALLDQNGFNVIDSIPVNVGTDESQTVYFRASFIDGLSFASGLIFAQDFTGEGFFAGASIYFSAPIISSDGELVGILRIQFDGSILQDTIARSNDAAGEESFGVMFQESEGSFLHIAHGIAPETLYTTLVQVDDSLITEALVEAGSLPALEDMAELSMELPELQQHLSRVDEEIFFSAADIATGDRINQVAVLRLTNNPNWIIAFFQPQDIFLSAAQQQSTISAILVVIISALVAGVAMVISQNFSRPIIQLTEVAQRVASGDLTARAEITSKDEIGILTSTFNSMTAQLDDVISNLETTVSERTHALERRASYLESAAEVGRTASEEQDLEKMLDIVAHLIADRFGFYHVGILLLDKKREYAELLAANSEGGWRMIARGHKLRVGEQGIVGSVTNTGEAKIEQTVAGEDAVHFANPELPYTRSEMALPLIGGGIILGALDVQSTEEEAFSEEDIVVLQVLADQVAMAISNNLLLTRIQDSVESERRAYGEVSGRAWIEKLQVHPAPGYISDRSGITEADRTLNREALEAYESGKTVVKNGTGNGKDNQSLTIPIKIQGNTVLGLLETNKPVEKGPWTPQEIELLESISDQLGVALENARLFEETQRQAERERITADVSRQIWSSTDIDKILQTAVEQLGSALNVSQGTIRLNVDEQKDNEQHDPGETL